MGRQSGPKLEKREPKTVRLELTQEQAAYLGQLHMQQQAAEAALRAQEEKMQAAMTMLMGGAGVPGGMVVRFNVTNDPHVMVELPDEAE